VEAAVSELRQALYRGERAAAEALVADGADLNVFDAAALGDVELLCDRLTADPEAVNAWSADGFTPLHFAAFLGGPAAVRLLLDAGADVGAISRNEMQVQPLHSAAASGNVDACRLLLEGGANPSAQQQGGYTALDEAEHTKNNALASLLRDYCAQRSGNKLPS
jgi:ankyrin repeat protein